jgi:arylsulfatase A-like enzyme
VSVERSVGNILKNLEERGLADNTVIIFLSDHGTHYGEKQLTGKWTPYEPSVNTPFIIYDPRPKAQKGKVLDDIVLNIDIAPTLLDLAGEEIPGVMDGRSMLPVIDGVVKDWRTEFFFEHYASPPHVPGFLPRYYGVNTGKKKYARWENLGKVDEEYFDLEKDPLERTNLIGNPGYSEEIETLRSTTLKWRKDNPSNYDPMKNGRPHFGNMEIDWEKFKEVSPEEYARVEAEVKRLGISWDQAVNDWELRYEICTNARHWY